MAIRDMDIAAEIIGVSPLRAKLSAFAVSSFFVGVAGALYFAVYFGAVEVTDAFGIRVSFLVLFMVIIGGLGSIFGSFAGAAFMVLLPILLKNVMVGSARLADRPRRARGDHAARGADHVLPDRGAARAGAALAAGQGEAETVAVPALTGAAEINQGRKTDET